MSEKDGKGPLLFGMVVSFFGFEGCFVGYVVHFKPKSTRFSAQGNI